MTFSLILFRLEFSDLVTRAESLEVVTSIEEVNAGYELLRQLLRRVSTSIFRVDLATTGTCLVHSILQLR